MNRRQKDQIARSQFLESNFGFKPILELDTNSLSHEQWLALRGAFIAVGGSDIGVLMGFSEYKSPKRLFYEKLGILTGSTEDNKYTFMGRIMEGWINDNLWCHWGGDLESTMRNHKEGIQTRAYQQRGMIIDPERPYIVANIDGCITVHPEFDEEGILETKKLTSRARDKYEGRINPGYIFQLQGYMMVTGAPYGELAIFEDALDFEVHLMLPNETIQEAVDDACRRFVDNLHRGIEILATEKNQHKIVQYLSPLEPPEEPSALLSQFYTQKRKALEIEKKVIGATKEFQDWVIERQRKDEESKALKGDTEILDAKIKGWMDKEMVTKVELDEGYVTFNDRLYFHPSIKKKLLQITTP